MLFVIQVPSEENHSTMDFIFKAPPVCGCVLCFPNYPIPIHGFSPKPSSPFHTQFEIKIETKFATCVWVHGFLSKFRKSLNRCAKSSNNLRNFDYPIRSTLKTQN